MTGILVLAHGSREKDTEETLVKIIQMLKKELGQDKVEMAFLQFSDNNLKNGLLKFINKGINDIKVIPYFLFEGVHIKEDIPEEIRVFLTEYPDVNIQFGRTLGADERLAKIVADRVRELNQV